MIYNFKIFSRYNIDLFETTSQMKLLLLGPLGAMISRVGVDWLRSHSAFLNFTEVQVRESRLNIVTLLSVSLIILSLDSFNSISHLQFSHSY